MEPVDEENYDSDELRAIAALDREDIRLIDLALRSSADDNWRKLAYVVAVAMNAYPDRFDEIPDGYYASRVRQMVASGEMEGRGDLAQMRFSEVRHSPRRT